MEARYGAWEQNILFRVAFSARHLLSLAVYNCSAYKLRDNMERMYKCFCNVCISVSIKQAEAYMHGNCLLAVSKDIPSDDAR